MVIAPFQGERIILVTVRRVSLVPRSSLRNCVCRFQGHLSHIWSPNTLKSVDLRVEKQTNLTATSTPSVSAPLLPLRRPGPEGQLTVLTKYLDRAFFRHVALYEGFGKLVFDVFLQGTFQRAGAVFAVGAGLFDQPCGGPRRSA